jgi:MFS transporter, FHS family, L-fucose permease
VIGVLTIPKVLSQQRALQLSALVGTVFTVCVAWIDPANMVTLPIFDFSNFQLVQAQLPLSVVFVALLGLANALVWPAIWPLAIDGLGPVTKTGSALLIMAILGGALVMPVWTLMAGPDSAASAQNAYWLCLPCYLFIGWYAIKGSRLRVW